MLNRIAAFLQNAFKRQLIEVFVDTLMSRRVDLNRQLVHWLPARDRYDLTLVIAHFPDTFTQIQSEFENAGIPYSLSQPALSTDDLHERVRVEKTKNRSATPKAPVLLVLSGQLSDRENSGSIISTGSTNSSSSTMNQAVINDTCISFLIAERHPSGNYDQKIIDFAKSLNCRADLGYFMATDDPLVQNLLAPSIVAILENFGMVQSEAISSSFFSSRIRRLQNRIATQIPQNISANSSLQWLQISGLISESRNGSRPTSSD